MVTPYAASRATAPVAVRLDRLLAGALAVSRREIARWAETGALAALDPRRRVTDGLELRWGRGGCVPWRAFKLCGGP